MTAPEPHESTLTRRARRALRDEAIAPALDAGLPEPAGSQAAEPVAVVALTAEEGRHLVQTMELTLPAMAHPESPEGTPAIFRAPWTPTAGPRPAPRPPVQAAQDAVAKASVSPPRTAHPAPPAPLQELPARHARRRLGARLRSTLAFAAVGVLLLGGSVAVTTAVAGPSVPDATSALTAPQVTAPAASAAPPLAEVPAPTVDAAPAFIDVCAKPAVAAALTSGDDAGVIAAVGGAAVFRQAVASATAPCVPLGDPARVWAVINKLRALSPLEYEPAALAAPAGVRAVEGGMLRADAAAALSAMAAAATAAGVGEIALESGYRSYAGQAESYATHVSQKGSANADLVSARPGFSEHQTGLAADLVACGVECGTLDDFAGTPQGQWVLAHAWEHGWVVRYLEGGTAVTGYLSEPWHLRYIGVDLARAYHEGGWRTLEEFFGLSPAPGYAG